VVQPEEPKPHVEPTTEQEDGKVELKVVGKINLDDLKPKKKATQPKSEVVDAKKEAEKEAEKEVEKVETPLIVEEVAKDNVHVVSDSKESEIASEKPQGASTGDNEVVEDTFRAEAPTLKG
jgi:hypothetical protein